MADLQSDSAEPEFLASRAIGSRPNDNWMQQMADSPAVESTTPAPHPTAPVPQPAAAPQPATPPPSPQSDWWGSSLASIGSKIVNAASGPLHVAEAIGSDIGKGLVQAPKEILGGALDAFNNIAAFAKKVPDPIRALHDKFGTPDANIRLFNDKGQFDPAIMTPEEAAAKGGESSVIVPTLGSPESITGNVIRAATSFIVGRGQEGSVIGGAPNLVRNLFAGGVVSNPDQPRLSNVIDKVAPNFVTDWLKAKPEDEGSLLGNLKSAMELGGFGQLVDGAVAGLKWLKSPAAAAVEGGEGAAAVPVAGAAAAPAAGEALAESGEAGAAAPEQAPAASTAGESAMPGPTVKTVADHLLGKPFESEDEFTSHFAGMEGPEYQEGGSERMTKPTPPEDDLVKTSPDLAEKADQYLNYKTGDNPAWVNIDRLDTPDAVQEAIARVATQLPSVGVQSNDATRVLASSLGLTPEQLLSGYQGVQLDAAQTTAMRLILNSSAEQLVDKAVAARAADAAPEDMLAFTRAYAVHNGLQQYMANARVAAARTLQAWSIQAGDAGPQTSKAIQNIIDNVGPNDMSKLASQISDLADPDKVSGYIAKSTQMSGRDIIQYGFMNYLLSPLTVVKKVTTDTIAALWNVTTRFAAEQSPIGMSGEIPPGETAQLGYGYLSNFRDAFKIAGRSLATGEHFLPYNTADFADVNQRLAALAGGTPEALDPEKPTQNFANIIKMFLPTRWIGATDDFAKYVNYRAELRALAYRAGIGNGLEGGTEAMADHISDTMENVPIDMHQQAVAAALKNTFQEPLTGFAESIQNAMNDLNLPVPGTSLQVPIGRILMPFIKVPFNLMKFAYQNSPLAIYSAFSDGTQLNQALAAGGATRDLALSKMVLGSGVALSLADLASSGTITGRGPSDFEAQQAWRRAGNQPYSIKIGNNWYNYNSVEPFGLIMGTVADTMQAGRYATNHNTFEQAATSLAFGLGNSFLSKTYMSGLANFFDALENPDADAKRYTDKLVSSFVVPQTVQGLDRAMDPWMRSHYDLLSQLESVTPFYSDKVPPARNLWGDPIPREQGFIPAISGSGLARMVSPVHYAPDIAEPIDKWAWDNRDAFPTSGNGRLGLSPPSRNFSFGQDHLQAVVPLTPEQYDHLRVIAGNGLKDPETGLGAKDSLNAFVEGNYPMATRQAWWNNASNGEKALYTVSFWNRMKTAAEHKMLQDDPSLQAAVNQQMEAAAAKLQGVPQ